MRSHGSHSSLFTLDICLTALEENLISKSQHYRKPGQSQLFLFNNYCYIRKILRTIASYAPRQAVERLDRLIVKQRQLYLMSWSPALEPLKQENIQLSLKDRFKTFAAELEELVKVNKGYSVPDPESHQALIHCLEEKILLPFREFTDKHRTQLAANPKWLKYDVTDVHGMLASLFEA